jgi:chorismate mutase
MYQKASARGPACAAEDMASMPATVTARMRVIFTGNSLDAGSAFTKVTFVDDQALQLLCDYY